LGAAVRGTLLLDNSAWVRLGDTAFQAKRGDEIADALESGRIAACSQFLPEASYSARKAREHDQLLAELRASPSTTSTRPPEQRALDDQAQFARHGHRLPPVDLLIAALADRDGLGVLHYDHDYDVIAEKTDLSFDSVWLADRGSLRRAVSAVRMMRTCPLSRPRNACKFAAQPNLGPIIIRVSGVRVPPPASKPPQIGMSVEHEIFRNPVPRV